MKLIISPAKKMNSEVDGLAWRTLPVFLDATGQLLDRLRGMSYPELKKLWGCSDALARPNFERLQRMDLRRGLVPALLCYEGIQYQYMAPGVFTGPEYDYLSGHLRILSGFYGLLRPFDGVTPYRLEMQAKLQVGQAKDLYGFWGGRIADALFEDTDWVLNLASKEYSLCVSRYLRPPVRMVTCVFGELREGRVVEKGTLCKMARGAMVRYLAERQTEDPDVIRAFSELGYRYAPQCSEESRWTFLRENDTNTG